MCEWVGHCVGMAACSVANLLYLGWERVSEWVNHCAGLALFLISRKKPARSLLRNAATCCVYTKANPSIGTTQTEMKPSERNYCTSRYRRQTFLKKPQSRGHNHRIYSRILSKAFPQRHIGTLLCPLTEKGVLGKGDWLFEEILEEWNIYYCVFASMDKDAQENTE